MIVAAKTGTDCEDQAPVSSPIARRGSPLWRLGIIASGALLLGIGLLCLFAWGIGEPIYTQLDSSAPPLHYNAAIGFLIWGCAFLALANGKFPTAKWLSLGLSGFALVLLFANIPALGLHLDHWAFGLPTSHIGFPSGGASVGLAIGFCLGGLSVVAIARQKKTSQIYTLIPAAIGLLLLVASPVLFVTQIGNAFTRPAGSSILGTAGITIAGLALLTSLFRNGLPSFALGHLVPISVSILGTALTFALWLGLNADQNRRIKRQVQFEEAHLQRLIHDRLVINTNDVVSLAENWQGMDEAKRKDHTGSFVGRLPGCLGVAQVDGSLNVRWIESTSNLRLPQTLAELGMAEHLARAVREGRTTAFRPPRSNWRGSRVLIIFAAHRSFAPIGGLICVIRVQDLLGTIVNSSVAPGYAVSISEPEGAIFSRYDSERKYHEQFNQTIPLHYEELVWRLSIWPTQDILEKESLSVPKLALIIGLLTTGLLALAVHLAQTARRRTFALENEVQVRELAQRALTQSEAKYRTLIENLGQGIFLQDREHHYVAANAQFCKTIGKAESEIVGSTETDLFEPKRAAMLAEEVRTVLVEGKSVETEEDSNADGKRICIRRVLTPVRDASGRTTGVLGICWDVTEQRQLEVHVHQASKMDAIGQLAGGIAHDFNNLLTVILGNLELMLANLSDKTSSYDLAVSARNAAARATSLTQRLLGFSRRHQLDWTPTNLNITVAEVVELLQRTINPLIRIETQLADDLWSIQADSTQLNQVLMNLCLNARDAIDGAGKITIQTACVSASELTGMNGRNLGADAFVKLRVTDTGSGMPLEVKARMYEPFFTTKEVGKGTGLGLPMVFAIVRQHKGWIDCWSEVGKGTRFDIYLPRGEAVKPAAPEPIQAEPSRTGKETILIVDDEEMIRQLAAATLQSRGYTVLQAEDGQQAINLYSREGDRIDLVLLDLTMPILSGHEAFRHLLALNPRVRVLFASGYAVEQLSELEKEMMAGFVNKPYRPNELVLAVEDALLGRGKTSSHDREIEAKTDNKSRKFSDGDSVAEDTATVGVATTRDDVFVPCI
jgi:PAS domain S-box-containing protein